jgi:hypothetical protein
MYDVTIRGIIVGPALSFVRKNTGARTVQKALQTLTPDERRPFEGLVLPFHKFPLRSWDKLLNEMRRMGCEALGIDEQTFDQRLVNEGGSEVMRVFFSALLSLFDLEALVKRMPQLHTRAYDPAYCEVVAFQPGKFVLRYRTSADMHDHYRRYQGPMIARIIELAGRENVRWTIVAELTERGEFTHDVEVCYDR